MSATVEERLAAVEAEVERLPASREVRSPSGDTQARGEAKPGRLAHP